MTRLWHGFAAMGAVDGAELVLRHGEGSRIWDDQGREYLDATAGLWFAAVGHGRAEIGAAAARQMRTLAAHHCFGDHANEPAIELADRLAGLVPMDDAAVFFCSGGSEAVDTAGKLARRYWSLTGSPERTVIISRQHAYHGVNAYGTSLAGIPANADGFGPLVGDTAVVAHDDPQALAAAIDRHEGRVAAFIGEPVIGAGGVIPPPDGYWPAVAEICRERDVLLVCDEVICGFGRLGYWFGSDRYGVRPDIVTCAKALTSGYLPLGAVIASERVREPFWLPGAPPFRHGYTYSGHAAACAAAIANLDLIVAERLVERVATLEPLLASLLEPLRDLPGVADVRHVGLLGAVEMEAGAIAARPSLVDDLMRQARTHGVLTRGLRGVALQLSPAYVVTEEELAAMVDGIGAAISDLAAVRA